MSERELTQAQLDRLDCVDNAIHALLEDLSGGDLGGGKKIDWDMEFISIVREAVQDVICARLKLMTEMEFYPYTSEDEDTDEDIVW